MAAFIILLKGRNVLFETKNFFSKNLKLSLLCLFAYPPIIEKLYFLFFLKKVFKNSKDLPNLICPTYPKFKLPFFRFFNLFILGKSMGGI